MADIGIPELLIVLAIMLVLFGLDHMAGLGRMLRQNSRKFRSGIRDEQSGPA